MRVLALALCGLIACVTPPPSGPPSSAGHVPAVAPARPACAQCGPDLPSSEPDCLDAGGRWQALGPMKIPRCNLPTTDAGTPCDDNRVCQGVCAADDAVPAGTVANGRCFGWRLLVGACVNVVSDGVALGTVCFE